MDKNTMTEEIKLLPIRELCGKRFLIPNYQRGYRWGRQQVRDLLDDIKEFRGKSASDGDDFYCLQPLVVCKTDAGWEVIDGQQRLTTIYLLLSFLRLYLKDEEMFSIQYATRRESELVLEDIVKNTGNNNKDDIDAWHMREAYKEIEDWFNKNPYTDKSRFREALLDNVKFIWYVSNEDPVKVFTRLNIGKIGLTNSELIKALFLNRSNFTCGDAARIRLRQIEIATRWDQIEAILQDEGFWMFLHEPGFDKPTRIDFMFDLMCKRGSLDEFTDEKMLGSREKKESLGNDDYRTFRYFNAYFNSSKNKGNDDSKGVIERCWKEVDEIFVTFKEWFDDLQLYHYVGFLVDQNIDIADIYKKWRESGTKTAFIKDYLIPTISTKLKDCNDLNKQYEIDDENGKKGAWKTQCRPLLLLHNLQTVIDNNKQGSDDQSGVFYKFPFHLYKKEKWDIEHIDSNSTNDYADNESRIEFLVNAYSVVSKELQEKIAEFSSHPSEGDSGKLEFNKLKKEIEKELGSADNNDLLDDVEKNKIGNFTLLDSHTNRSYGNAIFAAKRRIIIGKDKGKYISIPKVVKKDGKVGIEASAEKDAPSAFIPPCTMHVFLKYYSTVVSSPNYWTKRDAEAYREDIYNTLKIFGVTKNGEKA